MDLHNQNIVVMGGGSGIGLAAATALAALGARVTITGRTETKLHAAASQSRHPLSYAAVDATSEAALAEFYGRHGRFDHLVLTLSGAKGSGPFSELSTEILREGFEAKFFAHFSAARAALPYLSKTGSITFVSAISASGSLPGTAGLAAINGAIEAMVRPLARELRPLRINAVSPGVIESPWWDGVPAAQRKQFLETTANLSLVGRNGKVEEAAQAIVFVVTNAFVTGSVLVVDGGIRLS